MAKMAEDTPLIKQFFEVKAQHPEAILLYRVGDFYETYSDDAVTAARVLGLVQTKKSNGDKGPIPMAGFPHHAIENYLTKLGLVGAGCLQGAHRALGRFLQRFDHGFLLLIVRRCSPGT